MSAHFSSKITFTPPSPLIKMLFSLPIAIRLKDCIWNCYKAAFEWYRKAAEQNYPQAKKSLAFCYSYGIGVEIDERRGRELFEQLAQTDDEAKCRLGIMYMLGQGGLKADAERAKQLWHEVGIKNPYDEYYYLEEYCGFVPQTVLDRVRL